MDETTIRNLVKEWYQRARRASDPFSKFVFLYFCFNAWLAYESNEDRDDLMVRWLKSSLAARSRLRYAYETATGSDVFQGYLDTLASHSPIIPTGRRVRKPVEIESRADFPGIAQGIYQVRCKEIGSAIGSVVPPISRRHGGGCTFAWPCD